MYKTLDHGSSIELEIEDVDAESLFTESLLALSSVFTDAVGGTEVTHDVEVAGPDTQGLLVEWVNELVRLAEVDGFIAERVYKERLGSASFRARIAGERGVPPVLVRRVFCRSVEMRRLENGAYAARVNLEADERPRGD